MAATTILRTTKKVSPTENTPALQAKNFVEYSPITSFYSLLKTVTIHIK